MNQETGLTLIELLTTIAIVALLAVVAVPSFKGMTTNNRMVSAINELVADLQYARSEAIKRGRTITLCAANNRFNNCASSSDWSNGWLVRDAAGTPKVLRIHEALDGGDTLSETDLVSGDTAGVIAFSRNGFSRNARTLVICPPDTDARKARAVNISTTGRVHTAWDSNEDGIVEGRDGNNISCASSE